VTRLADLDVLGMACCCWDLLGVVKHYADLDEKVPMTEMVEQGGGQAATAMAGVARVGGRAAIVGRVGDDKNGGNILAAFDDAGVDRSAVRAIGGATSQYAICIIHQPTGKRSIFYRDGTMGKLQPDEVPGDLVQRAEVVLLDSNSTDAAIHAAMLARELGKPVVLDLEKPHARNEELVRLATHPVFPLDYGQALTGATAPMDVACAIQAMGPETVVVTLGERGCLALDGDDAHRVPAYRVPVVDTTGAGDVFHGVFAYGLAQRKPLADNLRFASAAAALCCRGLGGRATLGTIDEVEALLASGETLPLGEGGAV
jgi:sulfofructose kinase